MKHILFTLLIWSLCLNILSVQISAEETTTIEMKDEQVVTETSTAIETNTITVQKQATAIYSQLTVASFAPIMPGDKYLLGNTGGNQIEVELSNGQRYYPITDDYGEFYIELPWQLSSNEKFVIYIYDSNGLLLEEIIVNIAESTNDDMLALKPVINQVLVAGQALISGQVNSHSLVSVMRSNGESVIMPSDSNGYFYLELLEPLEANETVMIKTRLKNGIESADFIQEMVMMNDARPTSPIVQTVEQDSHVVKGTGTPNATIVLRRLVNNKYQFSQVNTDNQGTFEFRLAKAFDKGETISLYEMLAYDNQMILSPQTSFIIE